MINYQFSLCGRTFLDLKIKQLDSCKPYLVEIWFAVVAGHVQGDGHATCTFTKNGNFIRITSKEVDVAVHPLHCCHLILQRGIECSSRD